MVKVVELLGFTGVEPCTATLPTPGSISASVASVEVHERVVESPLLMVEGDAESVTVGCAAGAGAACVGGAVATCFLQPPTNAKTVATPSKSVNFRIVPACINFLLPRFPGFLAETAGILSAVSYSKCYRGLRTFFAPPMWLRGGAESVRQRSAQLFWRPVGRFVLALIRQLPRQAAIGEHGPDVPRAGARGFENKVTSVGRPAGPLVATLVARQFHELPGHNVHDIDIEITARPWPARCGEVSI